MNGTDHACYRYCERIIGMPTKAIPAYLEGNKNEIQGYISQLAAESTFLYYGKTDPKYPASSYYINDEIIIICRGKYVRTLYRVKFNLPPPASRKIIRDLVKEIVRQQKLLGQAEGVAARKKVPQDNKLAEVEAQILKARQRLKALEKEKHEIVGKIEIIENKPRAIDYDIQLIMQQLCCLPGDRLRKSG